MISVHDCAPEIFGQNNERPFDAIRATLSPEINSPNACNDGFLREDAILVIVTDEEDDHEAIPDEMDFGSMEEPSDWHQAVMTAKIIDRDMWSTYR